MVAGQTQLSITMGPSPGGRGTCPRTPSTAPEWGRETPAGAESPAGYDGVDMDVAAKVLPQVCRTMVKPISPPNHFGFAAKRHEGCRSGPEEEFVHEAGISGGNRVKVVGQREHDMLVADIEQKTTGPHPEGLDERLTLGTVPVTVGGVLDSPDAAFAALGGEPPERGVAAVHHRPCGPELLTRHRVVPAVAVEPGA